jgi:hypothetical protein
VRCILLFTAAGVWLASALGLVIAGGAGDDPKGNKEASCGSYGTSVKFVSSPSEAARQAKLEEKLVFVLHVSGHFEDPTFT